MKKTSKMESGLTNGHGHVNLEAEQNEANGTNSIPPASAHSRSQYIERISIPLKDIPAFTPTRRLRCAIIGAGFSGMTMAHKLQYKYAEELGNLLDFVIYEARSTVGGTWDANTYRKLEAAMRQSSVKADIWTSGREM
jgi:NADH dehydrogenase FAD-containing subunit